MTIEDLIGKTAEEALALCEENDFIFRIVRKDGISFPMTMDARPNRFNVALIKNYVVDAYIG